MPLTTIAELNGPPEEVQRRINQARQLSALYDVYVNTKQDGHDRAPGIHASELYPCIRQPVYSLSGVARKPQVAKFWKQRFKMGQRIHSMLQDDFHDMAKRSMYDQALQHAQRCAQDMDCDLEFQDEVRISPEHQPIAAYYKIYSSSDGVFIFRDRQTKEMVLRVGLEIKSASPDDYAALKAPKFEHMRQAHLYMGCLDLPLLWFLYVNKGNQNNTKSEAPYLVVYQPAIWAEIEQRFQEIHNCVNQGVLPPRTETVICEFCAWAYTCKPGKARSQSQPYIKDIIRKPGKVT